MKRKYISISSDEEENDDNDKKKRKKRKITFEKPKPTLDNVQIDLQQLIIKLSQLNETYKYVKFDLPNIFKFINETQLDKKYVHFSKKDVESRLGARLYVDAGVTSNPGLYCSLVHIQGQLLKSGQPKYRLIPTERIKNFDRLSYWIKYFVERDFTLCVNSFIEGEEVEIPVNWLNKEVGTSTAFDSNIIFDRYKFRTFCLVGVLKALHDFDVDQRFIHLDEDDTKSYQRLYFDDKTSTVGFFCDLNEIKNEQYKAGVETKDQIPKKRILSYLELIDYIMYLKIYEKRYLQDPDEDYVEIDIMEEENIFDLFGRYEAYYKKKRIRMPTVMIDFLGSEWNEITDNYKKFREWTKENPIEEEEVIVIN